MSNLERIVTQKRRKNMSEQTLVINERSQQGTHEAENAGAIVRRLYEAFMRGDVPGVVALLSPNVIFRVPGHGLNTGEYRGPEEVLGFLGQAMQLTGGTLQLTLHDILVGDDYVAAVATYRAMRPDRAPLENNLVHLMRVEGGQVTESWYHSRNQYEVDAFWS